jgi:hypothetical protein
MMDRELVLELVSVDRLDWLSVEAFARPHLATAPGTRAIGGCMDQSPQQPAVEPAWVTDVTAWGTSSELGIADCRVGGEVRRQRRNLH